MAADICSPEICIIYPHLYLLMAFPEIDVSIHLIAYADICQRLTYHKVCTEHFLVIVVLIKYVNTIVTTHQQAATLIRHLELIMSI